MRRLAWARTSTGRWRPHENENAAPVWRMRRIGNWEPGRLCSSRGLLAGRAAGAFARAAGTTLAMVRWTAVRAVGLELFEADGAIPVRVDRFEDLRGFGGICLPSRAGFEFFEADGAIRVRVEFLKNFLGTRTLVSCFAAGSAGWACRLVFCE